VPLQKWKANQVFEAIEAAGLNPREFGLDDEEDGVRIVHRRSQAYFLITNQAGMYLGRSLVGDGIEWPYQSSTWQFLMPKVSTWLKEIKADLDMPDLWAELLASPSLASIAATAQNLGDLAIDAVTQQEVVRRLDEIGAHMSAQYRLTTEQKVVIEAGFSEVRRAVRFLDRKAFIYCTIGVAATVVATGIGIALAPEAAQDLFRQMLDLALRVADAARALPPPVTP